MFPVNPQYIICFPTPTTPQCRVPTAGKQQRPVQPRLIMTSDATKRGATAYIMGFPDYYIPTAVEICVNTSTVGVVTQEVWQEPPPS